MTEQVTYVTENKNADMARTVNSKGGLLFFASKRDCVFPLQPPFAI